MKRKVKFLLVNSLVTLLFLVGCENRIVGHKNLKYFEYGYGNYRDLYTYKVSVENSKVLLYAENIKQGDRMEYEKEVDKKILVEIEELLNKYKVHKWNGFAKQDDEAFDGSSFHLLIKYDKASIKASGYVKFPDGFDEWSFEMDTLLKKYIETE